LRHFCFADLLCLDPRPLDSLARRARSASRTKPSPRAVAEAEGQRERWTKSEIDSANETATLGSPFSYWSLVLYGSVRARRRAAAWVCRAGSAPASSISTASSPRTAKVHAAAWKEMFDAYHAKTAREQTGEKFVPFDPLADYDRYVDGKPRTTASARSWPRAESSCPTAIRTTRRRPRRSTVSETARTSS